LVHHDPDLERFDSNGRQHPNQVWKPRGDAELCPADADAAHDRLYLSEDGVRPERKLLGA